MYSDLEFYKAQTQSLWTKSNRKILKWLYASSARFIFFMNDLHSESINTYIYIILVKN